jgi:hypothetical protein
MASDRNRRVSSTRYLHDVSVFRFSGVGRFFGCGPAYFPSVVDPLATEIFLISNGR